MNTETRTEGRPDDDTGEARHPQVKQMPQKEPNLLTPWSQKSSLQMCEEINFCFEDTSLWYFIMAAAAN